MQLIDRISGNKYSNLTRIAKDDTIQLFVWKQAPGLWRYVVWDFEDGSAKLTGPQHATKRDALIMAEHFAERQWGVASDKMTI